MKSEKGSRGQVDADHIQKNLEANESIKKNPGGFTDTDRLGYQAGVGYLYKKGEKFGFEADSGEPDEPIVKILSVSDNDSLTEEELGNLQEVVRVSGAAYSIGNVGGKQSVVCTERWGMNHKEHRTADGWVMDYDNRKI